jgi:hypothetical protein
MDERGHLLLSWAALPGVLLLLVVSLSSTPTFRGPDLETDFREYYTAVATKDHAREALYEERVARFLDFRLWRKPAPVASYSWVGMFSGNDTVSLTSGTLSFAYLLRTGKSTGPLLVVSSLVLTALLLVGLTSMTHNILTCIFRFPSSPNRSYLIYRDKLFTELDVGANGAIGMGGAIGVMLAFLPGWLIGVAVGYVSGDFSLYLETPVVAPYLVFAAHLYCTCAGGLVVLLAVQVLRFALLRLDINVTGIHFDEVTVAALGVVSSTLIFRNDIGTSTAVTLAATFCTLRRGGRM